MQIAVDGAPYFVTIPAGVRPGMTFDAVIPVVTVVKPPAFVPPAAIISDNHGSWTRIRYDSLRGAERAWSHLGFLYASVLFVQTPSGTFNAFKEYGTSKAVDLIKKRFHEQFKYDLFPELRTTVAVVAPSPAPVVVSPPPPPQAYSAPPPAYQDPPTAASVPPAYQNPTVVASAPPAYAVPSAPPKY